MGLTLITGRANSGKTGHVMRRVLEAAAQGMVPQVVVPTVADARRLERELMLKSSPPVRVSTLRGAVEELWMLHGDGRRLVSASTRSALARSLVESEADPSIADVSRTPGFLRFLERALSASGSLDGPQARPTRAMLGIIALAHAYQQELESIGMVEPAWLPHLLAERQVRLEGPFGVARFDIIPSALAELFVGLARHNEVLVSLTWRRAFFPTAVNDKVVAQLAAGAERHVSVEDTSAGGELGRVADGVFGPPTGLRSSGSIVTGVAAGEDGENRLIAGVVEREIRAGTPPDRIAVVCRNAGQRSKALAHALESAGVRSESDVQRSFLSTRFGHAVAAVMALAVGGGSREDACALLTSPYCDSDRAEVDALDRRWRIDRVVDRQALLRQAAAAGGNLGACLTRAQELAAVTLTGESAKKWQEILDILLAAPTDAAIGSAFGTRTAEDAAAHRAISRAISEMVATAGSVFDARDIAGSLGVLRLALPALETPGHVQILDADSVGSRRYDVVVLFDLTASGFPVTDRESLEAEMQALLGQESTSRAAQSRSDFYGLLTRARQRLYLVRRTSDAAGEPVAASPVWDALLDLYRPPGAEPDEVAPAPPPLVRVSLEDLASWAPVFSAGRRAERIEAATSAFRGVERGVLVSESAIELLSQRKTFSITEVETYLQCPYRWFYDRVVRPHEIDSRFDGRELGTRAHRYLAAFYERLPEELPTRRMSEAILEAGLELFDRVSRKVSAEMAPPGSVSEELMAARGLELARQVVADDTLMFPLADAVESEVTFDEFEFAGGRFRGRADRIDTGPSALFVTDYKTSATIYGYEKFADHGLVQAVLYGVAAQRRCGSPVTASVYRSLRARRCRGFWRTDLLGATPARCSDADGLDEPAFQALVDSTEERVANALAGMRSGSIPRSRDAAACKFCSIANMCRNGDA